MQWPEWIKDTTTQWVLGAIALPFLFWLLQKIFSDAPAKTDDHSIHTSGTGNTVMVNQISNTLDMDALAEKLAAKVAAAPDAESANMLQAKTDEIQALKETIRRLQQNPSDTLKQQALQALQDGDTQQAVLLMEQSAGNRTDMAHELRKEAAQDWLDIGNIAYLTDSHQALAAYQKALALDAFNVSAWNQSGLVLSRLGRLDDAMDAYQKVLELADENQSVQAVAYGNLGIIYQTRGDLDKAESFYMQSLELNEALGRKEGMASDYGNLGIIYKTRGDLDKACEAWHQSLDLFTQIGAKRQMDIVQSWIRKDCYAKG